MAQTGRPGGRGGLENNRVQGPIHGTPPSFEGTPDSLHDANNSVNTSGYVPDSATNRLAAAPAVDQDGDYPALVYPQGSPNTNRIKSDANTKVGI